MKTRRSFASVRQCVVVAALLAGVAASLAAGPFGAASGGRAQDASKPQADARKLSAGATKQVKIDLGKAVRVALPKTAGELTPVAFKTADGKAGWVVRVPGRRPLATPAYADGMLF